MCCDSPDYPQVDPRQIDALLKQTDIAERLSNYTIESGRRNEARLDTQDARNAKVMDAYMEDMDTSRSRANQMWERYENTAIPMQDKTIADANNWDSDATLNKLRGQAYSETEKQFGLQRDALQRNMGRMGVNPTNGRYTSALAEGGADLALAKVQAANALVEGRRTQAVGMRAGAANATMGFANTAAGLAGQTVGFGNGVAGVGAGGINSALGVQGAMTSGMNAAGNMFGNVANGYGNVFNQQLSSAQAQDANDPMKTVLGAAGGVGTAWALGKFK